MTTSRDKKFEPDRQLHITASKIIQSARSGLTQRFLVESGEYESTSSAEVLRDAILEIGTPCFIHPLNPERGRLPNKPGIWIIPNADLLKSFAISAWLKTQLDNLHPALTVILVVPNHESFIRSCTHPADIGATAV